MPLIPVGQRPVSVRGDCMRTVVGGENNSRGMQQPGGGSQFMAPFSSPRAHLLIIDPAQQHQGAPVPLAEVASPINSRSPSSFDELAPAVGAGNFPEDDEDLAAAAGEEVERGGAICNRWPRQETLALLNIRSDMDATFRDSNLKGPLWEGVSRKLAELGYKRSAKKCKEKFENVHKYYKRTKEGRASRHDGKSYRFFTQLEALHKGAASATGGDGVADDSGHAQNNFSAPMAAAGPSSGGMQPLPISSVPPPIIGAQLGVSAAVVGLSFSSGSSSSDTDGEDTEDAGGSREGEGRKRKRGGSESRSNKKMMTFFEGLMKQVMERQEVMQQRFLETVEKREQDRMIREEAWRRQEMARVNREQELLAQERAVAANRHNALISYLQKITGQTIPMPIAPPGGTISAPTPAPQTPHVPPLLPQAFQRPDQPPQHSRRKQAQGKQPMTVGQLKQQPTPPPQKQHHEAKQHHESTDKAHHQPSVTEMVGRVEPPDTGGTISLDPMLPSSRWPKAEVHALISVRSGLESRYEEAGPKGPLWEEISAAMKSLGYSRSAKRCKEKWENINKYFKKVKESSKNRPEDAKTCPYFHQLDALYRKKHSNTPGRSNSTADAVGHSRQQERESSPTAIPQAEPTVAPAQEKQHSPRSDGEKNGNNSCNSNNGAESNGRNSDSSSRESGGVRGPNSNGGLPPSSYLEECMKKKAL